ncbi:MULTISPECIES: hypothetical protein [unclassified Bordetella]|uniref:hypothetical protein n=1 Tax=unclassified Bordetella TaxID=2630031 RepID=UPI00132A1BD2|nr:MULTISPECIES: hypothetical protein [unclassified Bordetella]MVW71058.1 hypothetical protein [Bordetella sp. 15P40C-2]MVW80627.1 hypothetical protein [Bordetella sp. 02P26C-1]
MDTHSAFACPVSYTIRPRVHEMDAGQYRGCVEVIGRDGERTFSFTRFSPLMCSTRERAEFEAMRLAQQVRESECSDGRSWVLPGQLSQRGEVAELAGVPSSLLSPPATPTRRGKRHLRVAA